MIFEFIVYSLRSDDLTNRGEQVCVLSDMYMYHLRRKKIKNHRIIEIEITWRTKMFYYVDVFVIAAAPSVSSFS